MGDEAELDAGETGGRGRGENRHTALRRPGDPQQPRERGSSEARTHRNHPPGGSQQARFARLPRDAGQDLPGTRSVELRCVGHGGKLPLYDSSR
jgi:hypothetical protein